MAISLWEGGATSSNGREPREATMSMFG
jgi:hypothetical protein